MKKIFIAATGLLIAVAGSAQKCNGTTKAGQPCKAYALAGTDKCHVHTAHKYTCGTKTKSGTPCKRAVKAAGQKCFQHQ